MFVEGRVHPDRQFGLDTFVDITGPGIALVKVARDGLTFDSDDLTDGQVAEIKARMTSRDADDQAARGALAAISAAMTGAPSVETIAAAVAASISYQLGES